MTLEDFYFISQIFAAIGIMLSLVFVGFQIRQNTAQSKADAAESAHRGLIDWQMSVTPELAAIAVKANEDFGSLSTEEHFLLGTKITPLMLDMQEAHTKHLEGSLVESRWRAWDQYATFSVSPAVLGYWAQRRLMFSDSFQAFYDAKIAEAQSSQPLHSFNYVFDRHAESEPGGAPNGAAQKEQQP